MRTWILACILAAAVSTNIARAQTCATYPNALANGSTADASQVMGNFNCAALLGAGRFTGNVGIVATNPQNLLVVGAGGSAATPRQALEILNSGYGNPSADNAYSNGDKFIMWNGTAGGSSIKNAMGNDAFGLYLQASGYSSSHIGFWTGSTSGAAPAERVHIDSAGNTGIGTSTPAYPLDVAGSIRTTQAVLNSSAAPTISACGTSPPAAAAGSNNNSGQLTLGTGSPTACTVTFANAFPSHAFCTLTAASSYTGSFYISSQTNAAFTVTLGTGTSSVKFNYTCGGN